ncbi:hypothetical protein ACU4GD_26375 [Cupriavidus basilensis]
MEGVLPSWRAATENASIDNARKHRHVGQQGEKFGWVRYGVIAAGALD